jgi:hypothetical protein
MRKVLLFSLVVLCVSILAGVTLTLASRPGARTYEPSAVERYLYGAYPFADEARLVLSNSTMHGVTIKGKLYSPSGQVAPLEDIVLPAHEQRFVELTEQIAQKGPEFRSGGIKLGFESADPGIAAQLAVRDEFRQQPINIPLKSPADSRSSRLEGLWWFPSHDTHFGLIIYNRGEVETAAVATVSRRDGTVVSSVPLRLGPNRSQNVDLRALRSEALGELGGISIQHDGRPGTLLATGFVDVPSRRHTMSLSFADPQTLYGANLYGAGVQLGTTPLAEDRFSGQLFVRNVSSQAIPVTPSLQCGETRTALPDFALQAGEAKRVEVPANAITCETGAVGIEVATPVTGSLLGRWLSVAESSGLVVETAMHSFPPGANLSGSDPWWIDEETASILYVQNLGNQEAGFVPVIHYSRHGEHPGYGGHSDERYVVGLTRVRPGETVAIDVRALRDSQTPDVEGRVLPPDIRSGQIHWLRRHGPALVANVLTVNATKKTASTFSFFCCYCMPRGVQVELRPASVSAQVGDVVQETLYESIQDCHGFWTGYSIPVPGSQVSWSSNNLAVAPVDSTGRVFCGPFAGTATIAASKWVVWYSEAPPPPPPDGEFCYSDDPRCIPPFPPECQSFEDYQYATANFAVSSPPPPPSVAVTTADIVADQIVVSLSPTSSSGSLVVTAQGSSVSKTLFNGTKSGGQHTFSFDRNNLPNGQYTSVTAQWTVAGNSVNGSKSVSFNVLGVYRHSQYNTPAESACAGPPAHAYITNPNCNFNATNLRNDFISQSWLNGSGITIQFGTEQNEAFCLSQPGAPVDASGRSFRPQAIVPSCGPGHTVNNSTVARGDTAPLNCGDSVLIVGLGGTATTKTVTDRCPACTGQLQLDNYTTQTACQPGTIPDLGNFKTIRLR